MCNVSVSNPTTRARGTGASSPFVCCSPSPGIAPSDGVAAGGPDGSVNDANASSTDVSLSSPASPSSTTTLERRVISHAATQDSGCCTARHTRVGAAAVDVVSPWAAVDGPATRVCPVLRPLPALAPLITDAMDISLTALGLATRPWSRPPGANGDRAAGAGPSLPSVPPRRGVRKCRR